MAASAIRLQCGALHFQLPFATSTASRIGFCRDTLRSPLPELG